MAENKDLEVYVFDCTLDRILDPAFIRLGGRATRYRRFVRVFDEIGSCRRHAEY